MIRAKFAQLSLKNKFFFSILIVILLISGTIALLARWILISGLTQELEMRGTAIAHSVATRGAEFILENDTDHLLNVLFDEKQLHERKHLVAYIYVEGKNGAVLSHTFTTPFPKRLKGVNPVTERVEKSVRIVPFGGHEAYDIAVPIKEGIYQIGTVHVGLSKAHIDSLVGKLRAMFLGFISAVIIITFWVSHRMAKYIADPVMTLTQISDDLSRGNFSSSDLINTEEQLECPAFHDTDLPCWHFDEQREGESKSEMRPHRCKKCAFYNQASDGDEVQQLTTSFRNMVWSIRLYRRRLQESESTYRSLFRSGPDPIFVVDVLSKKLVDANPRTEELYGYTREELVGMPYAAFGEEQAKECFEFFSNDELCSEAMKAPRVVHLRKGNIPMYVNVTACFISYRTRPAIIVATTDVTDLVEKDAQLIQASKMKSLGEMSTGVAHELNQPLNAIRMGSDFLTMVHEQGIDIPQEQYAQVVTEISTQVDRASDIINTLRSFGRKADLLLEDVNLNEPVGSVVSLLSRQFLIEDVHIVTELDPELPYITAQHNKLQQVLLNLVINARDAIVERNEEGAEVRGRILIRTEYDDEGVSVSVEDNGTGIPDHVAEKVFEPFFTTKATGQGMGLGLAISYGIVREYGGELSIQSAVGDGTCFTVRFPRQEVALAAN
ncbi:ATP-binding protein [Halodesulfovibrio spirochaetisodalis]|uniref:histidine kinase n=1 Tax=Halodesulfovibrio spirochaetisodalis TaxID=1560234 RepID=A0A1B7X9G3_9BACT|nr:ATP-binding protein [Halodesulfovibrio spirochaetisodalis]OBQ45972.1 histidine kinase [Halodesulfovibrio spirochaetisodalis]